MLSLITQVKRW